MQNNYLVLCFLLVQSLALAGSVECRFLIECLGGSAKACELRFKAAEIISRKGTGAKLLDNGKKLDIPKDDLEKLTAAFIEDYQSAADTPGASPAAKGNVGHMKDHFDFIQANLAKFTALGLDIPSLKLAMAAHDVGKGFLDKAISDYIKLKAEGSETKLTPFLRDFILSHELHSIAGIPRVIKGQLKSQGIDVTSSEGKAKIQKYSEQIMEAIRLHNGVDVTGDLKKKYPSLNEEEIQQIQKAWWPENYKKFAEVLGLKQREYGGTTNPIGEALNFIDRATLTSPSAPQKLMTQNFGFMPWGIELIEASTTKAAQGNIPLIKAQGTRLEQQAQSEEQKKAAQEIVASAQKFNQNMIGLGTTLSSMDKAAGTLGIPKEVGTVRFQRDGGPWIRINGQDKTAGAFIERWDGSKFIADEKPLKPTSPVDLLMIELKAKGLWPPK